MLGSERGQEQYQSSVPPRQSTLRARPNGRSQGGLREGSKAGPIQQGRAARVASDSEARAGVV